MYAHSLREAGGRSVGVNLLRALPSAGPGHDWLFVFPAGVGYGEATSDNAKVVTVPRLGRWRRSLWEVVTAPRIARDFEADWIISLGNVAITRGARRRSVLLHDPHLFYPMSDLAYLGRKVRFRKRLARRALARQIGRQAAVFVQTDVAARRVADTYRLAPDRITVVPNAVSSAIPRSNGGGSSLGIPRDGFNVLVLTKYAGRKGLETVVSMFEMYRDLLPDVRAIFTVDASRPGGGRDLMKRVSEARLSDRVLNLGPVDQSHLAELYGATDLALLPSLLESYSGVYAESMAFRVPIVTSDRDFAREVCGEAAVYVEPRSPLAIAQVIAALAADPRQRAQLADKGTARLAELDTSWEQSAQTIIATIEQEGR